jgi:ATP-dependent Clp protease adaptor protein ClpS
MSTETIDKVSNKIRITPPKRWNVLIHDDNKTTFDFVMYVLSSIFNHDEDTAHTLTSQIHHKGKAIVGCYGNELAHAKVEKVISLARANNFPLKATCEIQ